MTFLAGIIGLDGPLEKSRRFRFLDALGQMEDELSWPVERIESDRSVLVQASFPHLWQNSKLISNLKFDAAAIGVQWKKIPNFESALDYLLSRLLLEKCEVEDYFDYFNCVILDKGQNRAVLGTDSLGISPVIYSLEKNHYLTFSSHQIFFKHLLGDDFQINWQGAFEYLIIGHNIGNKTLIKGLNVLPPGSRLVCTPSLQKMIRDPAPFRDVQKEVMTLEAAVDLLFNHLIQKCQNYSSLTKTPMAGLLSGGWDSRLLISIFFNLHNMAMTYTSQQKTRFQKRLISERKIAKEVAQYIGVKNQFISPRYRSVSDRDIRASTVDYSTWFHDWAFTLAQELPRDQYIFCDGLLGDILLRGLYIVPELQTCMEKEDKEAAVLWLHSRYIKGFNTYTRGIDRWKSVIHQDLLDGFSDGLMEDISEEIHDIEEEDFMTIFFMLNRSRRGISPMPRWIFGTKGTVIFPFCGQGFIQKILSLPIEFRLDHSLYRSLLERSMSGLSKIASTNTGDFFQLEPYLTDTIPGHSGWSQFFDRIKGDSLCFSEMLKGIKDKIVKKDVNQWEKDIVENPPRVFMSFFNPDVKNAIRCGDSGYLKSYRFFLDRIKILDHFFS